MSNKRREKKILDEPRVLDVVQTTALSAASNDRQRANEYLQVAHQRYVRIMEALGLDPAKNYSVAEDGTVSEV